MNNLTLTDKILASTILPLIPRWITPNAVTWFRLILIPFVAFLFIREFYIYGLILFFFSSFSDAIDGSLARTRNMVTEWGKTYDPLADKLLIGMAAFILITRFLSVYLAITIIAIELFLFAGAYYRKRTYGLSIEAELSGKIKMALQSFGVGTLLIAVAFQLPAFLTVAAYLFYLSIIFAIISLVVYKSI